jgi:1,4-alpha-glucan branching enzyme
MSVLKAAVRWDTLLGGEFRGHLEREALPSFLPRQRWYAGKARTLSSVRIIDETYPGDLLEKAILLLVEVRFQEGDPETYFVPLGVATGRDAERWAEEVPGRVLTRQAAGDEVVVLFDALVDPATCTALLAAIEGGRTISTSSGTLHAFPTSAYAKARGPADVSLPVVRGTAEQSNSAVLFGDRLILKVFRRLEPGINPDFEIGRFLSEKTTFDRIPKTAGAIEYQRGTSGPTTVAILQELVLNQGTGWDHALLELRHYFEEASRLATIPAGLDDIDKPLLELASVDPPPVIAKMIGAYLRSATILGRRTAELHLALASDPSDPAFAPEPVSSADLANLRDQIRSQVDLAVATLQDNLARLPEACAPWARQVLQEGQRLLDPLDELLATSLEITKIRCHGDYHLGQVLRADEDFVILDFEGEPAKPLARRLEKQIPLKDVVGMLRSFDYAAHAALFAFTQDRPDQLDHLLPWAKAWQAWTSSAFLKEYLSKAQGASFLPADREQIALLLRCFSLDKALYELLYELNNRPDWVRIPLRGILNLIEHAESDPSPRLTPAASEPVRADPLTGSFLSDFDLHLLMEGTHYRSYEKLGAHRAELDGSIGTAFAVWAPHAREVSVVGDFNGWDPKASPMRPRGHGGVWERFIPGVGPGAQYKYAIVSQEDEYEVDKADPYGFAAEIRPQTASKVWDLSGYHWRDQDWMAWRQGTNSLGAPISIYEVHLGSWMRVAEEGDRWLTYGELATKLVQYVHEMGYTHVELLPVSEHPFDGSWGYQPVGYFAPTSRFGTPYDFMAMIDTLHQAGIGVILDWVPAHFPGDEHGLGFFDGTHLYEHADPRQGRHQDWDTFIFNYGRPQVANFLISNALFWLDKYHIDGLRVDAVASMLYLDYSRKDGEWVPNEYGGRENLEAISLLRRFNERVHAEFPGVLTIAEESTAWPMVSRPTNVGGLGFDLKWDMGWMHDTLSYMATDTLFRKHEHNKLTFRGLYAFTENFVLPLSHDEVVHGKGSLLGKMPGDPWQKFANVRLLFGYMFGQPGKKLMFMGCEFGQWREWNHDTSLDWDLLSEPLHQGLRRWVRDLNTLYRGEPPLHELDCHPAGFLWVDPHDAEQSVVSLIRKGKSTEDLVLIVCNFTPIPRYNYRVGVPRSGHWEEILNGDATLYGGSGQGNIGGVNTTPVHWHGHPQSLNLTLPPLAMLALRWRAR